MVQVLTDDGAAGTSLVVLSYYHFSWWADLAHWLITGTFFFGTAVPVGKSYSLTHARTHAPTNANRASLMPPSSAAHMSWDNYFAIADLSYHVPPTSSRYVVNYGGLPGLPALQCTRLCSCRSASWRCTRMEG